DLTIETRDHLRIGQQLLADYLEGGDTVHADMARFEDVAGAAFAEQVENLVGAEHQFGGTAVEYLVGLEGSQPAAQHELLKQEPRIGIAALKAPDFVELAGVQDAMLRQQVDQIDDRIVGHVSQEERNQPWEMPRRGSDQMMVLLRSPVRN